MSPFALASIAATLLVGGALVGSANAAADRAFTLAKAYAPNDFLSDFEWYTKPDPTMGLVNYQSQSAALRTNLTEVKGGSLYLRVDTTPTALEGRGSVRITSKDAYSDGVYVLNVSHVPYGCSTWPAFWTVTTNYDTGAWPAGGEIDIIENANDEFPGNLVALHTLPGCTIPSSNPAQLASSTVQYTDCNGQTAENTGCRVMMGSSPPTWGRALNNNGGGTFAMVRDLAADGSGISVYYWQPGSEPVDIKSGSPTVKPSGWGTPAVNFNVAKTCASYFGPHYIVIDTTLAGTWAAATWNQSGNCAATYGAITDQVAYNGSSYSTAYWQINSLRVFNSTASSSSSGSSNSSGKGSNNNNDNSSSSSGSTGAAWSTSQTSLSALIGALLLLAVAGVLA